MLCGCGGQRAASFRNTLYAGDFCGVTVLTAATDINQIRLFHSIVLPIIGVLNTVGVPTFLLPKLAMYVRRCQPR
jgi:hypothetical protein